MHIGENIPTIPLETLTTKVTFLFRPDPCKAQCLKWQHFYHKCHCFIGYCHMFTIKHYDTLIYFPDQNFNFSNPSLCNFDLRWQILIWSYLIDNTFTEITLYSLILQSKIMIWDFVYDSVRDRCYQVPPHKINLNSNSKFGMQWCKMVLFRITVFVCWFACYQKVELHCSTNNPYFLLTLLSLKWGSFVNLSKIKTNFEEKSEKGEKSPETWHLNIYLWKNLSNQHSII